jgi:hypothetical protein
VTVQSGKHAVGNEGSEAESEAERQARAIEAGMSSLPDSEAVYREWRTIVVQYGVMGVQVHDARFAAAMRVNRVSHIVSAIY